MTGIKRQGEKTLMLFAGRAYPELAEEVGRCLGIEPTPTSAYEFANGEIFVRFDESVRGSDAFVIQSHTAPINKWIMEQLIMIDALKRASAKRITVVVPFYGYARQDKKHRGREPISARLLADRFAPSLLLAQKTTRRLAETFARLDISGGAVYDALVALAAVEHDAELATRDGRARATYEAVGARVVIAA